MMAFPQLCLSLLLMGLFFKNSPAADETTETEMTWPDEVTEATLVAEMTWPNERSEKGAQTRPFFTARTIDPLDALIDEEEFLDKSRKKEEFKDSLEAEHKIVYQPAEIKARKRKPLPEEKLIKQPFYFGCCHNSTNVGCAGVCPETCEYRSKYCVPLCGPPCRCKPGYVYNIPRMACTLRTDCPKGIVQSKNGVYRVFL
ncbi:uncharacterized protein LOC108090423 [Drosophila ficusphila]|uniref:uncharacterized protein LOC108090423 n=1 Tax=Drosophila ficusphila TaxID=30025 RepID=UPI0007E805E9|nr:uncharacterized protein LOC108090423 [Drosophila ficusphila]